ARDWSSAVCSSDLICLSSLTGNGDKAKLLTLPRVMLLRTLYVSQTLSEPAIFELLSVKLLWLLPKARLLLQTTDVRGVRRLPNILGHPYLYPYVPLQVF